MKKLMFLTSILKINKNTFDNTKLNFINNLDRDKLQNSTSLIVFQRYCVKRALRFIYLSNLILGINTDTFFYITEFLLIAAIPIVLIVFVLELTRLALDVKWPHISFFWFKYLFFDFIWFRRQILDESTPDSVILLQNKFFSNNLVIKKKVVKTYKLIEISYYSSVDNYLLHDIDNYCKLYMNHQFKYLNAMAKTNAIFVPDILDAENFFGPFENHMFTIEYEHEETGEVTHLFMLTDPYQLLEEVWEMDPPKSLEEEDMKEFLDLKKKLILKKKDYYIKIAKYGFTSSHNEYIYDLIVDHPSVIGLSYRKVLKLIFFYWFVVLLYGLPWLISNTNSKVINTDTNRFFLPHYREFLINVKHSRDKFFLSLLTDVIFGQNEVETFENFIKNFQKNKFNSGWSGIRRKNTLLEFRRYESARMYERLVRANAITYFDEALRQVFYAPVYSDSNIFEMSAAQLRKKTDNFLEKRFYPEFPRSIFRSVFTAYSHRFLTAPREHPLSIKAKRLVGVAKLEKRYFLQRYKNRLLAYKQILQLLSYRRNKERRYRLTKYRLKKKKLFFSKYKQLPFQGFRQLPFNFYKSTWLIPPIFHKRSARKYDASLFEEYEVLALTDKFPKKIVKERDKSSVDDVLAAYEFAYIPLRFANFIKTNRLTDLSSFRYTNNIFPFPVNFDNFLNNKFTYYAFKFDHLSNTIAALKLNYNFNPRIRKKRHKNWTLFKFRGHKYFHFAHPRIWARKRRKLSFKRYLANHFYDPIFSFRHAKKNFYFFVKNRLFDHMDQRPAIVYTKRRFSKFKRYFKSRMDNDYKNYFTRISWDNYEISGASMPYLKLPYKGKKKKELRFCYTKPQTWFYHLPLTTFDEYRVSNKILFDSAVLYSNDNTSLIYFIGNRDFFKIKNFFSKKKFIQNLKKNNELYSSNFLLKYFKIPRLLRRERAKLKFLNIIYQTKPLATVFNRQNLSTLVVDGQSFPFLNYLNWDYRIFLNSTPSNRSIFNLKNNIFLAPTDYHSFFFLPKTRYKRKLRLKRKLSRLIKKVHFRTSRKKRHRRRRKRRNILFFRFDQNKLIQRRLINSKSILIALSRIYRNLAFRPVYKGLRWKRRYSVRQWRLLKLTKKNFTHPLLLNQLNSLYRQYPDYVLFKNTLQRWGHRYGYYHYDLNGMAYEPATNLIFLSRHLAPFLLKYPQKSSIYYSPFNVTRNETFLQKIFSYFNVRNPRIYLGLYPNRLPNEKKIHKKYTRLFLSTERWRMRTFFEVMAKQKNEQFFRFYSPLMLHNKKKVIGADLISDCGDPYLSIILFNARQLIHALTPVPAIFNYWWGRTYLIQYGGQLKIADYVNYLQQNILHTDLKNQFYRTFDEYNFALQFYNEDEVYKPGFITTVELYEKSIKEYLEKCFELTWPKPSIVALFGVPSITRKWHFGIPNYDYKLDFIDFPFGGPLNRFVFPFTTKKNISSDPDEVVYEIPWTPNAYYRFALPYEFRFLRSFLINEDLPEIMQEDFYDLLNPGTKDTNLAIFKQKNMEHFFQILPENLEVDTMLSLAEYKKIKQLNNFFVREHIQNSYLKKPSLKYKRVPLDTQFDQLDELNYLFLNRLLPGFRGLRNNFLNLNLRNWVKKYHFLELAYQHDIHLKKYLTYQLKLPLTQYKIYYQVWPFWNLGVINPFFIGFFKPRMLKKIPNYYITGKSFDIPKHSWQQFFFLYQQSLQNKINCNFSSNLDVLPAFFYTLYMQNSLRFSNKLFFKLLQNIDEYCTTILFERNPYKNLLFLPSVFTKKPNVSFAKLRPLLYFYTLKKKNFVNSTFPNSFFIIKHLRKTKILPLLNFSQRHKQLDARVSLKQHVFYRNLWNERLRLFKKRRFARKLYLKYLGKNSFYFDKHKNDFNSFQISHFDYHHYFHEKTHKSNRTPFFAPNTYFNFRFKKYFLKDRRRYNKLVRRHPTKVRSHISDLYLHNLLINVPYPESSRLYYMAKTFITLNVKYNRQGFGKKHRKVLSRFYKTFFTKHFNFSGDKYLLKTSFYPNFTILLPFNKPVFDNPLLDLRNFKNLKEFSSYQRKYLVDTPLLNNITLDHILHCAKRSRRPNKKRLNRKHRYIRFISLIHNNMLLANFWHKKILFLHHKNVDYPYNSGLNFFVVNKNSIGDTLKSKLNFFFTHPKKNLILRNYGDLMRLLFNSRESYYFKELFLKNNRDPFFKIAKRSAEFTLSNLKTFEPFWKTNFYKLREFQPNDSKYFWPHELATNRRIFKRIANYTVFAPTDNDLYSNKLHLELQYALNKQLFYQIKNIFKCEDYVVLKTKFNNLITLNNNLPLSLRVRLLNLFKLITPEIFYFNVAYYKKIIRIMTNLLSNYLLRLPLSAFKHDYYNTVSFELLKKYIEPKHVDYNHIFQFNRIKQKLKKKNVYSTVSFDKLNIILARRLAYQQAVEYLNPILSFFYQKNRFSEDFFFGVTSYINTFANNISNNLTVMTIPSFPVGAEGFLAKIFVTKFIQFYESNYIKLQTNLIKSNFLQKNLDFTLNELPFFWSPNYYSNLAYSYLINRFQAPAVRDFLKYKITNINNPYLLSRPLREIFYDFTPSKHFNLIKYLNIDNILNKTINKVNEELFTFPFFLENSQDLIISYLGNNDLDAAYCEHNIYYKNLKKKKLYLLAQNFFNNPQFKSELSAIILNNYYKNPILFADKQLFYMPFLLPVNFIKSGLNNFDFLKTFNAELEYFIKNQNNIDFLNDVEIQHFFHRLHLLSSMFEPSLSDNFFNYALFNKIGSRLLALKYNQRSVNDIFWQLRHFTRFSYKQHQTKDLFFSNFYKRRHLNPIYTRIPNFYNFDSKLKYFSNNPMYYMPIFEYLKGLIGDEADRFFIRPLRGRLRRRTGSTIGLLPEVSVSNFTNYISNSFKTDLLPFLHFNAENFELENLFFILTNPLNDREYKKFINYYLFLNFPRYHEWLNNMFDFTPNFSIFNSFVSPDLYVSTKKLRKYSLRTKHVFGREIPLFSAYFKPNNFFGPTLGLIPSTFDELQHKILLNRKTDFFSTHTGNKEIDVQDFKNNSFFTYPFLFYNYQKNINSYLVVTPKTIFRQALFTNVFFKNKFKINYNAHDKFVKQRFFKRPYRLAFTYSDISNRRAAFFKNHWRPSSARLRKVLKKRKQLLYKPASTFGPYPYHWSWVDELRAMVGLTTPRYLKKSDLRSVRHLTSHELEQMGLNYLIDYYPYLRLWYYSTEPPEYQMLFSPFTQKSDLTTLHYYEIPLQYLDTSELPMLAHYVFYDQDPFTLNPFWSTTNMSYMTGVNYLQAYFFLTIFVLVGLTFFKYHQIFFYKYGIAQKIIYFGSVLKLKIIFIFDKIFFFLKKREVYLKNLIVLKTSVVKYRRKLKIILKKTNFIVNSFFRNIFNLKKKN